MSKVPHESADLFHVEQLDNAIQARNQRLRNNVARLDVIEIERRDHPEFMEGWPEKIIRGELELLAAESLRFWGITASRAERPRSR